MNHHNDESSFFQCFPWCRELQDVLQRAKASEASAMEISQAHDAAESAWAAAEKNAAEASSAANAMQFDLDQCRHILRARDMQVQHLAAQFQEASHRLAVRCPPSH
jgi:hypothetical protein